MEIRYFAGAADAAGRESQTVEVTGLDVAALVARLGEDNDRLARVLSVSTLLADGARVEGAADLSGVRQLDVLPPFAGG
ncbi:MAG: MoaD/ThiS family protein [Tessaracoccus sp.]